MHMRNRSKMLRFAFLLPIFIFGVPLEAATAQTLSGPHVVNFEQLGFPHINLANDSTETIAGTALPDGSCQFTMSQTLQPGSPPIQQVALSYDPDSCALLMDVGNPVGDIGSGLSESMGNTSTRFSINSSGIQTASPEQLLAPTVCNPVYYQCSSDQYRASNESWYQDPLTVKVNDVIDFVEWTPSGSCDTAQTATSYWGDDASWFTATGWSLASRSEQGTTNLCSVFYSTYATFQNTTFCQAVLTANSASMGIVNELSTLIFNAPLNGNTALTTTNYNPNSITANPNGSFTATTTSTLSASGTCATLLRPMNQSGYY
jgi:hypothetical protein